MGWMYSGPYVKDRSPKAREILRLANMALERPDVVKGANGICEITLGSILVEIRTDYQSATLSVWETWSSGAHLIKRSKMLLSAVLLPGEVEGQPEEHIMFYDKRRSDWTLHELHKALPLEALAYYGAKS